MQMIVALFITFCSLANPNHCQVVRFAPENPAEATLIRCMMSSQPTAAEWLAANPGWVAVGAGECHPDRLKGHDI